MNVLLLINSIVFAFIGFAFGLWGSNPQSRFFGLVCMILLIANMSVMLDFVKV